LSGAAACTLANRVGILRSVGPDVGTADLAATATDATYVSGADNWDDDQGALSDTFDNQLILNTPDYDTPNEGTPGGYIRSGPAVVGVGWRGAYVAQAETDPWGKPYLANTAYLAVPIDAPAGYLENQAGGGYSRDVIVISAGPNGMFDSPFGGSANYGTDRLGDDIIYVIQGDTR
jgi:hypothetical protein